MAHYAELDENNIVINVIPISNDFSEEQAIEILTQQTGNIWKRTSYNTIGNEHLNGEEPFRGNFAGIGYTYNEIYNIFIPPKPYPSWVLNLKKASWDPPFSQPNDGKCYMWNEEIINWEEIECPDPNEGDPFGGPEEG